MNDFALGALFGALCSFLSFHLALVFLSKARSPGHGKPLPFSANTEEQEAKVESRLNAQWNDAVDGLGR